MSTRDVIEMSALHRQHWETCQFVDESIEWVEDIVRYLDHPDPKVRYNIAFVLKVEIIVFMHRVHDVVRRLAPYLLSVMLRYEDIRLKIASILYDVALEKPDLLEDIIPMLVENFNAEGVHIIIYGIYESNRSLLRNYLRQLFSMGFDPYSYWLQFPKMPEFRFTDDDFREIDNVLSQVPNIRRENMKLYVEGHLANYEIDFLDFPVKVKGTCKHNHMNEEFCVRLELGCQIDTQQLIEYVVKIAINLANDIHVIDDLELLKKVYGLFVCPRCIKDENIRDSELVEVRDKIIKRQEKIMAKR